MMNKKPNIVFINVDQLCQHFISAYGCSYLKTPGLDKLVENGVSFMHTYTGEPICTPARATWWTGLYPSEHGVVFNSTDCHEDIVDLGQYLRNNGYNAFFIGKWHVDGRDVEKSFDVIHEGGWWGEITDEDVTKAAISTIRNYNSDKPFFLNVGYLNPHDCCLVQFEDNISGNLPILEKGLIDMDELPPIPESYYYDNVKNATCEYVLKDNPFMTANIDETKWRYYIYKYARLCEMVDREIEAVVNEIENSPFRDNTIILFTSDHGDGVAEHRKKGKSTLWDESVKVPFMISTFSETLGIKKGIRDYDHFASGTDIFPTVCEIAGLPIPESISGMSMLKVAKGEKLDNPREFAYAESVHYSRMIRSKRYKYIMDYAPNKGDNLNAVSHKTHKIYRELLYDMEDKGELLNLSDKPEYSNIIEEHRKMLFEMESKLNMRDLKCDPSRPNLLYHNLKSYYEHFGL